MPLPHCISPYYMTDANHLNLSTSFPRLTFPLSEEGHRVHFFAKSIQKWRLVDSYTELSEATGGVLPHVALGALGS